MASSICNVITKALYDAQLETLAQFKSYYLVSKAKEVVNERVIDRLVAHFTKTLPVPVPESPKSSKILPPSSTAITVSAIPVAPFEDSSTAAAKAKGPKESQNKPTVTMSNQEAPAGPMESPETRDATMDNVEAPVVPDKRDATNDGPKPRKTTKVTKAPPVATTGKQDKPDATTINNLEAPAGPKESQEKLTVSKDGSKPRTAAKATKASPVATTARKAAKATKAPPVGDPTEIPDKPAATINNLEAPVGPKERQDKPDAHKGNLEAPDGPIESQEKPDATKDGPKARKTAKVTKKKVTAFQERPKEAATQQYTSYIQDHLKQLKLQNPTISSYKGLISAANVWSTITDSEKNELKKILKELK